MQVIGAGLGRTGTMSLKVALEQLGFGPCFHMIELMEHPERIGGWKAAAAGQPVDWDGLYSGYEATVDWPGAAFARELADHWPGAKVLLTLRDPDAWYESVLNTLHAFREAIRDGAVEASDDIVSAPPDLGELVNALIWEGTFDGRFPDRRHAIEVFERHAAEVRAAIPPEQLLVHEIADGWEPLAGFLGTGVPDAPFPRLNDTAAFRQMFGVPAGAGR